MREFPNPEFSNVDSQFRFDVQLETPNEAATIDQLVLTIFGPGMMARAATALRGNTPHEMSLSFTATIQGDTVGTVRQTIITIGGRNALLLGPLGVLPSVKNLGIGKSLMEQSMRAAKQWCGRGGPDLVILVGDLAYYKPFGFVRVPGGHITLPWPVDPTRVLACALRENCLNKFSGQAAALIA